MLYEKLKEYGESDYYGFHMPGHKRQLGQFINPYEIDITEIHGFDDLHHPKEGEILAEAQKRAARTYGAEETCFLINGSTAGILAAVSACVFANGKILMARNCHRSVYHAVALRNLSAVYLYPPQVEDLGINGSILPEDVEKFLEQDEEIQAVFVTSPTYDGVCSDIRKIAEICHGAQVPLIVDQAHGAHFPFSEYFPEDAIRAGADVVIHGVHKTLPSMTQTALLHLQGNLVNRERIRQYLSVYQSSSPSYVLMASIDSCMEWLEEKGKEAFKKYVQQLEAFRKSCKTLEKICLAGGNPIKDSQGKYVWPGMENIYEFDRSKLLFSIQRAGITGTELAELLRKRYHLQMEMSAPTYLVGISSVADTEEGFGRLTRALQELDIELETQKQVLCPYEGQIQKTVAAQEKVRQGNALEWEKEYVRVKDSEGRICAGYVYLYPPGIPLLVPGELISPEVLAQIKAWKERGLEIQGLASDARLAVLK